MAVVFGWQKEPKPGNMTKIKIMSALKRTAVCKLFYASAFLDGWRGIFKMRVWESAKSSERCCLYSIYSYPPMAMNHLTQWYDCVKNSNRFDRLSAWLSPRDRGVQRKKFPTVKAAVLGQVTLLYWKKKHHTFWFTSIHACNMQKSGQCRVDGWCKQTKFHMGQASSWTPWRSGDPQYVLEYCSWSDQQAKQPVHHWRILDYHVRLPHWIDWQALVTRMDLGSRPLPLRMSSLIDREEAPTNCRQFGFTDQHFGQDVGTLKDDLLSCNSSQLSSCNSSWYHEPWQFCSISGQPRTSKLAYTLLSIDLSTETLILRPGSTRHLRWLCCCKFKFSSANESVRSLCGKLCLLQSLCSPQRHIHGHFLLGLHSSKICRCQVIARGLLLEDLPEE